MKQHRYKVEPWTTGSGITQWWRVVPVDHDVVAELLIFPNPDTAEAVAVALNVAYAAGERDAMAETAAAMGAAVLAAEKNGYAAGWRDSRQSGALDRGRSAAAFEELEHAHPTSTPDPGTPGRRP